MHDGEYLFPGATERRRVEFLRDLIKVARNESGENRLQLHELRRCFASRLAERGTMVVVAELLGHALPGVTGLYVRADSGALRTAMNEVWSDLAAK